jgi:hypothetical protein
VVAALGLVLVVLVVWGLAHRQLRRLGARKGRGSGTTLVLGLPPVPAPRPRVPVSEEKDRSDAVPPVNMRRPALENVVLIPPAVPPRPVRRCGHCRAAGHTRTTCPRLTGALPLPHL